MILLGGGGVSFFLAFFLGLFSFLSSSIKMIKFGGGGDGPVKEAWREKWGKGT